ncbi:MAG: hypothetical protein PHX83_16530 [Acidobacteriia bacterium]|nr:hypothetical protein [Terriglobia bacterium]
MLQPAHRIERVQVFVRALKLLLQDPCDPDDVLQGGLPPGFESRFSGLIVRAKGKSLLSPQEEDVLNHLFATWGGRPPLARLLCQAAMDELSELLRQEETK